MCIFILNDIKLIMQRKKPKCMENALFAAIIVNPFGFVLILRFIITLLLIALTFPVRFYIVMLLSFAHSYISPQHAYTHVWKWKDLLMFNDANDVAIQNETYKWKIQKHFVFHFFEFQHFSTKFIVPSDSFGERYVSS